MSVTHHLNRNKLFIVIILVIVFGFVHGQSPITNACTPADDDMLANLPPPPTVQDLTKNAELVFEGTVWGTSSRITLGGETNYIVMVDKYYKGDGPFLLEMDGYYLDMDSSCSLASDELLHRGAKRIFFVDHASTTGEIIPYKVVEKENRGLSQPAQSAAIRASGQSPIPKEVDLFQLLLLWPIRYKWFTLTIVITVCALISLAAVKKTG